MQDWVVDCIALLINATQHNHRLVYARSLYTATASQALVAIGEASSIALALAADFAAAITLLPIVATFNFARAASVLAIRNAASL